MDIILNIIDTFLENPSKFFSIHQISKSLNIPYATTYNKIHEMAKLGCINIITQGKAKLCCINSENPISINLLATASSIKTCNIFFQHSVLSSIYRKIKHFIENNLNEKILTALLLNYEDFITSSLARFKEKNNYNINLYQSDFYSSDTIQNQNESSLPIPFDLFLVFIDESNFDENIEMKFANILPADYQFQISVMNVSYITLLGMLKEKENEAGLAAYNMLRKALILYGYEKFYQIILKAFPPPLL